MLKRGPSGRESCSRGVLRTVPQMLWRGIRGVVMGGFRAVARRISSWQKAARCTFRRYWLGEGWGVGKLVSRTRYVSCLRIAVVLVEGLMASVREPVGIWSVLRLGAEGT
jgi:hypothetical protein